MSGRGPDYYTALAGRRAAAAELVVALAAAETNERLEQLPLDLAVLNEVRDIVDRGLEQMRAGGYLEGAAAAARRIAALAGTRPDRGVDYLDGVAAAWHAALDEPVTGP